MIFQNGMDFTKTNYDILVSQEEPCAVWRYLVLVLKRGEFYTKAVQACNNALTKQNET
jgi:hypothetical protein